MHISETTVRRPVLAAVLSLFVVLIGLAAYDKLTIREYPDIDRPVVTVSTIYTGASSKILERDVTSIIEDSLAGISGIREITSESRDELSKIRIEFTLETDIDTAANDVRDKVSRVAAFTSIGSRHTSCCKIRFRRKGNNVDWIFLVIY